MTSAAGIDGARRSRRDALAVLAVAAAARVAVAAWAGARFPPAADGAYYHTLAERIAAGLGSTWAWPDGAVTFAAHYPVGYPALVAMAYRIAGATPVAAMGVNVLLGALGALAVHRLAARAGSRGAALGAGLAVALHPGLALYVPALMTEGATASLLAVAAWLACRAREAIGPACFARRLAGLGAALGVATLVRPQSIALAPLFGLVAVAAPARAPRRLAAAAAVTAFALATCAPWTARNCVRMHRCALVSVNGGWNLLIGAAEKATGTWSPVDVPPECSAVWDEAAKDACFGAAARRAIASDPARWLALAPAKLAATFDYCGAAPWYLHASAPSELGDAAKLRAGAIETVYERLALLFALAGAGALAGPRRGARVALAAAGAALVFREHAWIAVVLLAAALALLGRSLATLPLLVPATLSVLAATIATHAVFFGAGRYAMTTFPFVTAFAALAPGWVRAAREARRRPARVASPDPL